MNKIIKIEQEIKGIFFNLNLKYFLSKIDLLKNTSNYKNKGPYIYCAVKRRLNMKGSTFFLPFNLYHSGIFECTKELLIHYGEPDENDRKKKNKPLVIEKKTDENLEQYQVKKYFYSKESPENFINLIDKNEWTSEKFDFLYHNCIHCTNEYLILNNIEPIIFGLGSNIAYEYLCDKCYKELGRDKMYKYEKINMKNFLQIFYQVYTKDGDTYETSLSGAISEFHHVCDKCKDEIIANWKYDQNWLVKSEEESIIIILNLGLKENVNDGIESLGVRGKELALDINEIIEEFKKNRKKLPSDFKEEKLNMKNEKLDFNFTELMENFKKIGEPLAYALISVKVKKIPKYQYAIVRKNLYDGTGENKKNYGFIALVSLHESKIIEYGNEKYNNGSPVLRDIEFEDKYIYHIVKKFQLDKNIDELFHSINLTPWTGKRYDIFYYSSYNFINIYLNKYNQKLVLIKKSKTYDNAYLYLCRDCYKKFDHPDCYINSKSFHLQTHSKIEKEDKYWWCWECGKKATFFFIGRPLNIKYNYLCRVCYFELAEPKNYIPYKGVINNFGGLTGYLFGMALMNNQEICRKCAKFNASYKFIN